MSKFGSVDFEQWKRLHKGLLRMQRLVPNFIEECMKELAGRLLAKTVARTPVGDTGDLRRGWTVSSIQKEGSSYLIEVINPVEYAKYVEFGHRTRDHTGWVEGRFMLTISEKELQQELSGILDRKLQQFIKTNLGW